MGMEKKELIGSLDAGDGETRIDIVLGERDGDDVVALQLSTWHETLGWQAQKTIPIAADKIGLFQRLLSQTRNHLEDRTAPFGATARVIEFGGRGSSSQASKLASQPTTQTDDQTARAR